MRKGNTVLYENKVHEVLKRTGNAVLIYDPLSPLPETTMKIVSINKLSLLSKTEDKQ